MLSNCVVSFAPIQRIEQKTYQLGSKAGPLGGGGDVGVPAESITRPSEETVRNDCQR